MLQPMQKLLLASLAFSAMIFTRMNAISADASNQKLSEQRALSVKNYLVQQFGINADRLHARGFGEFRPVPGSNQNSLVGRAINRRVEAVQSQ